MSIFSSCTRNIANISLQIYKAKRIQLVADRTLMEIYIDGAKLVGTISFLPIEPFTMLEVTTKGLQRGWQVIYGIWKLEDIWTS